MLGPRARTVLPQRSREQPRRGLQVLQLKAPRPGRQQLTCLMQQRRRLARASL